MVVVERVGEVAGPVAEQRVRGPVFDAFIAGFHSSSLVAAGLAAAGALAMLVLMRPKREVRA